jgi:hypothetical protein
VNWGMQTSALLDDPSRAERLGISVEQMQAKLGWLQDYRVALAEWSEYRRLRVVKLCYWFSVGVPESP